MDKTATRGLVLLASLVILALVVSAALALDASSIAPAGLPVSPQAYLPLITKPRPTPFAIPGLVQAYHMEYAIETSEPVIWMPEFRYWDGNGVRDVSILEVSPPPAQRYREDNRTAIIYWENPTQVTQTFKVSFDVELGLIEYAVDDSWEWPAYDVNSLLYQKNITTTAWVQVDHPEIQSQAASIVGAETNPYRKAKLIHEWMVENIDYISNLFQEDALSTLRNGGSACGGKANLFVALCRASGVPARNVTGLVANNWPIFESGQALEGTLNFHVWAEFYLPDYGWIQDDPGRPYFARIEEHRLITAKGSDIWLGWGNGSGELSWFHVPHNSHTQLENSPLWLTVTEIP